MKFGLYTECRNPAEWRRPDGEVYGEIIDQMVMAESLGFGYVDFLEHHFTDDGYLPSPLMVASAVAARTKTLHVCTNIAILPLYNPIRFAEDTAVLDCISNGRLEIGMALGYRPEEYAGLGINYDTRGGRFEEALQIMLGLWHGEVVNFRGKHFQVEGVKISPLPVQKPHPMLWLGGFSPPGFRRAAKYGDGYTGSKDCFGGYEKALLDAGKDATKARYKGGHLGNLVVSNDPERSFAQLAPHVIYHVNTYAQWFKGDTNLWPEVHSVEELKKSGMLTVLTPEDAVRHLKTTIGDIPYESFGISLGPPGLPASEMRESLELFSAQVMPHFS